MHRPLLTRRCTVTLPTPQPATSLLPPIQADKVRPLAVTGARRWSGNPGLPTIAETGYLGFEAVAWDGIVTLAATAGASVARLNAKIAASLCRPDIVRRVEGMGWEPAAGSAEDFRRHIADERVRWEPVIRRFGAQPD